MAAKINAGGVDRRDRRAGVYPNTHGLELAPCALRRCLAHAREQSRAGLDEVNLGRLRADTPELPAQRVPGYLDHAPGELDAGRAAADDREAQPVGARHRIGLELGTLERGENPPAQVERVLERLEAGRVACPVVVAEVAVRGAARDDKKVVLEALAACLDRARDHIDGAHLVVEDRDVFLPAEDLPQRRGDVGRGERCGCHLVEQRLEQVMVAPVDQDHVDVRALERTHGPKAAEAPADHDDPGP